MRISSHFALEIVLCAALSITLWAAWAGVGFQLLPRATGCDMADSRRRPGVAAGVGLGALMMIGGVALVLRIPWWLYTGPFVVIGLVLAVREFLGFGPIRAIPRSSLLLGTLAAAALGVVVAVIPGRLRFLLDRCDDLRAYLPIARRLIETYGLEEAWSARRARSLGGFDLLRALPVAVFQKPRPRRGRHGDRRHVPGWAVCRRPASIHRDKGALHVLILGVPFAWVPHMNASGILLARVSSSPSSPPRPRAAALRAGDTQSGCGGPRPQAWS